MSISNLSQYQVEKRAFIYRIIFCIGVVIAAIYVFLTAPEEVLFDGSRADLNMWDVLLSQKEILMLFGHSTNPITMPPVVLALLIYWIPLLFMISAAVILFLLPDSKLNFIVGTIGIVMFIGVDVMFIINTTVYIGIFINLAGTILAAVALALYYIGDDDERIEENNAIGEISCLTGELAGGRFIISDTIVIGKSASKCNIVLKNATISRVHCIIRYVSVTDTYTVKDVSSNGTFFSDGSRLVKGQEMQVIKGTELRMGEPVESFYLD